MKIKEEKFSIEGQSFSCYTVQEEVGSSPTTRSMKKMFEPISNMKRMKKSFPSRSKSLDKDDAEKMSEDQIMYKLIYDENELKKCNILDGDADCLDQVSVEELVSNSDLIENIQIQEQDAQVEKMLADTVSTDGKMVKRFFASKILLQPLIKILDRDYKVFRLDIDKAIHSLFTGPTMVEEFVFSDTQTNTHEDRYIQIVEKNYWKNNCLERHEFMVNLNRRLKNFPRFKLSTGRTLVLFQGLNKNKTGFFEFLAQHDYLSELKDIYGTEIYLLTYPTWFVNVPDKIQKLKEAFDAMSLDATSEIDFLCTSTGSVVGRGLAYELRDTVNIRSIICVNGPNTGTSIAELTHLGKLVGLASLFFGPVAASIMSSFSSLTDEMVGVHDLRASSNIIPVINANYNTLNRTNDFFIGTESRRHGDVFDDKPNDNVIPVASMKGKVLPDADYGYDGEEVNALDENIMIVSLELGGNKHGQQYRNRSITDFIMDKLKAPSSPAGGADEFLAANG